MAGRESAEVRVAVRIVRAGATVTDAARQTGVAISTVRRALRRRDVAPLPAGRSVDPQKRLW